MGCSKQRLFEELQTFFNTENAFWQNLSHSRSGPGEDPGSTHIREGPGSSHQLSPKQLSLAPNCHPKPLDTEIQDRRTKIRRRRELLLRRFCWTINSCRVHELQHCFFAEGSPLPSPPLLKTNVLPKLIGKGKTCHNFFFLPSFHWAWTTDLFSGRQDARNLKQPNWRRRGGIYNAHGQTL